MAGSQTLVHRYDHHKFRSRVLMSFRNYSDMYHSRGSAAIEIACGQGVLFSISF